jgi:hypothetical protein
VRRPKNKSQFHHHRYHHPHLPLSPPTHLITSPWEGSSTGILRTYQFQENSYLGNHSNDIILTINTQTHVQARLRRLVLRTVGSPDERFFRRISETFSPPGLSTSDWVSCCKQQRNFFIFLNLIVCCLYLAHGPEIRLGWNFEIFVLARRKRRFLYFFVEITVFRVRSLPRKMVITLWSREIIRIGRYLWKALDLC